ncbi:MAG: hypothetical protein FJ247_13825 [Nitrospira sp.]|nr:hypothetical protein [Nitrospira sp.]
MASFRSELEKVTSEGIPSLHDMESGKLVGAVLPMSEQAQVQMRNSIRGGSGWLDSIGPFLSGAWRIADYAAVCRVVRWS